MKISALLFKYSLLSFLTSAEAFYPSNVFNNKLSFVRVPLETSPSTAKELKSDMGSLSKRRTLVSLSAKKRRRRRRETNEISSDSSELGDVEDVEFDVGMNDDLPEFDLGDKEQLPELIDAAAEAKKAEKEMEDISDVVGTEVEEDLFQDNDPLVLEAMKASKNSASFASPKELLRSRDRNLEATFEFDEVKSPLPQPGQDASTARTSTTVSVGGGKKRARAEARRAAAMEAAELEAADNQGPGIVNEVMGKLPFYPKTEEGEEASPLKLVEQGTWACIYILVAWELYINSPLFDRASPLIPVVYDLSM